MTVQNVTTHKGARHVAAECEVCGERWYGDGRKRGDVARMQARRHAGSTGHTVFVESSRGTYFNLKDTLR
jgi:hypothetical protein